MNHLIAFLIIIFQVIGSIETGIHSDDAEAAATIMTGGFGDEEAKQDQRSTFIKADLGTRKQNRISEARL